MRKRQLFVLIALCGVCCLRTTAQSSANYCSQHVGTLYCLTPNLYANSTAPDPFTAVLSAVGSQLALVPLASPASGIVYTIDPNLKIVVANGSETFGPVLVDRGETLGAHKLFLAFTYQHFSFSSIDGIGLGNIPIVFKVCDPNNGQCAPIATTNRINPTINQFAFFGTYGITSRIDISVVIPLINSTLGVAGISCTMPYCQTPIFSNGDQITFTPASAYGSATGLGDVVARVKGQLFERGKVPPRSWCGCAVSIRECAELPWNWRLGREAFYGIISVR